MASAEAPVPMTRFLEVLGADGRLERSVAIEPDAPDATIGRLGSALAFPDDEHMADAQARLSFDGHVVQIEDSGQGSGVWLRLRGAEGRLLEPNDQLWLGSQILVVAREGERWQLCHHGPDGRRVAVHDVPEEGLFVGRASDLVLDPSDTRLSRRHAQLVVEPAGLRCYDRGAHNGSYLRLRAATPLQDGDELRLATQRVRYAEVPVPATGAAPAEPDSDTGGEIDPETRSDSRAVEDAAPEPAVVAAREMEPDRADGAQTEQTRPSFGLARRLRAMAERAEPVEASDRSGAPEPVDGSKPSLQDDSRSEDTAETPRDRAAAAAEATRVEATPVRADDAGADAPGAETPEESASNAPAEPADAPLGAGAVLVVIDSPEGAVTLEAVAGQTVLEAVQQAGLERAHPVDWECGDGGCGVCVLGVVEGADRMDPPPPDSKEMQTIQITEQVAPDPARYRLACLARVRGTVRLRKLT